MQFGSGQRKDESEQGLLLSVAEVRLLAEIVVISLQWLSEA